MAEQELTYEKAFPGRFLAAPILNGKTVTLTITKAYMEILEGDKGKQNKLILAFSGKDKELVCNKTNAFCMKEMFGNKISGWVGKRVAFFPTKVAFGEKQVDALRIAGSPDIAVDIAVAARMGRKNFKAVLKAMKGGTPAPAPAIPDQIAAADDRMRELVASPDADPVDYPEPDRDDEGNADYGFGGE
jgi:hypothetical protein